VVSPETGFFVSVIARNLFAQFGTSIGVSGRHDFAVRLMRHSSKAPKRPPHPAPNVRDDRETPLVQGHGTAGFMDLIWAKREAVYFCSDGWTGSISLSGFENLLFSRNQGPVTSVQRQCSFCNVSPLAGRPRQCAGRAAAKWKLSNGVLIHTL
jgi:hypothetical protein